MLFNPFWIAFVLKRQPNKPYWHYHASSCEANRFSSENNFCSHTQTHSLHITSIRVGFFFAFFLFFLSSSLLLRVLSIFSLFFSIFFFSFWGAQAIQLTWHPETYLHVCVCVLVFRCRFVFEAFNAYDEQLNDFSFKHDLNKFSSFFGTLYLHQISRFSDFNCARSRRNYNRFWRKEWQIREHILECVLSLGCVKCFRYMIWFCWFYRFFLFFRVLFKINNALHVFHQIISFILTNTVNQHTTENSKKKEAKLSETQTQKPNWSGSKSNRVRENGSVHPVWLCIFNIRYTYRSDLIKMII